MLSPIKNYFKKLGPGVVTGAADDDPSGIATYSQTGAQYGFQLLWVSIFTFPLMSIVQEMCARIGIVTGRGLAGNIRLRFPRYALYVCTILLFGANTFNIGADLAAMGEAAQLLYPHIPLYVYVAFFCVVSLWLQITIPYKKYSKYIKYLAFVLVVYIIEAFIIKIDWAEALRDTALPSIVFSKEQIILICAILGTTISPYLFFWQTSQEVEEQISEGRVRIMDRKTSDHTETLKIMNTDVWTGMFFSNLVMFFIILVSGQVLFSNGITDINSAADAAKALEPFAGKYATVLFALGIIGTGLLAVPVLAGSSAYAIAETFRFKEGLYRKFKNAHAFYFVIIFSMCIGFGITLLGIDPIKSLVYSAILNGIVAPVVLVFIVLLSSNKAIMGEWVNSKTRTILGWGIVTIMAVASLLTMYLLIA